MQSYIQYKIFGEEHLEVVEVDHISLALPAFLMRFYPPSGELGESPGPDWVKVCSKKPSAESTPFREWNLVPQRR